HPCGYASCLSRPRPLPRPSLRSFPTRRSSDLDPLPALVLVVFPVVTMAFLKPAFQPALAQAGHPHANGAEQVVPGQAVISGFFRSEEHTSELQSRVDLVCRLLREKKKGHNGLT